MTGLLSTISGFFTKSILLGTLLPVAVFVTSFFILVRPLLPVEVQVLLPLAALDPQWKLVAVTLFTILISGLLYSLNIPIMKLFEGYTWIKTPIGKRRKRHYQTFYEIENQRIRGMRTLVRAMHSAKTEKIPPVLSELKNIGVTSTVASNWQDMSRDIKDNWDKLQRDLFSQFPTMSSLILPTRLGNIIRSFEYYPHREYKMDAITTWSRLVAKIDPKYAATIDDAKTSFDFMINLSFLSAVSLILQLAAGLTYGKPFASAEDLASWLLRLAITAFLIWGFYHLSFTRAAAWGETIKGAFDLYRKELLAQLGFDIELTTRKQERVLWENISIQMIYGDHPDEGPLVPAYAKVSTPAFFVEAVPADVQLRLTRGLEESLSKCRQTIVIVIKNVDEKWRSAENVIVTDTLENNFHYRWNSATLNGHDVPIEGINPYRFEVGNLANGEEVELRYKVIRSP